MQPKEHKKNQYKQYLIVKNCYFSKYYFYLAKFYLIKEIRLSETTFTVIPGLKFSILY